MRFLMLLAPAGGDSLAIVVRDIAHSWCRASLRLRAGTGLSNATYERGLAKATAGFAIGTASAKLDRTASKIAKSAN
jgi:hypothetical protein